MPGELGRIFKLASGPEEYGLQCDRHGLTLAGVPLLRKSARGFAPRSPAEIRRLIGDAYDVEANVGA